MRETFHEQHPDPGTRKLSWGAFDRLPRVFWEPTKVFAEIRQNPTFFWVLLAQIAVILAVQLTLFPKIDMEATIREAVSKQGKTLSEEQLAAAVTQASRVGKLALFLVPLGSVAVLALLGGVYFLSLRLVGSNAEYPSIFSAVAHASWPPTAIQSGLLVLVASFRSSLSVPEIPRLVKSNLAAFLPDSAPRALEALGRIVDVFNLWSWILLVLALEAVGEVKRKQALGVVVVLWGLWALFQVVLAFLRS